MKDIGHEETEKVLEKIEKQITKEYARAEKEIAEKLETYMEKFATKDELKLKALAKGMITEEEYEKWRVGQVMIGQRWAEMRDTIAEDLTNADKIAKSITYGHMPEVYAINHDYGTFQVEKASKMDTSYTLYDRHAMEQLIKNEDSFMPAPGRKVTRNINEGKALAWNKKEVQSCMMQGLLQGESISKIADRLEQQGASVIKEDIKGWEKMTADEVSDTLAKRNRAAAIRNARTMTTGVQNAGRLASYERANKLGIETQKKWSAVLDRRTRHWHASLDGEVVDYDQPFENEFGEIMYPGDPSAAPVNIYNCRCGLSAHIKEFPRENPKEGLYYSDELGDISYDDWKAGHYTQKSDPITKQEDIANAMKQSYNNDYRKINGYAPEEDDEGLISDAVNKIKSVVSNTNDESDVAKILSSYPKIEGEHSYLDDLKATNPNYATAYANKDRRYIANCQRCVNAYEARRRGYDVTASERLENDLLPKMMSKQGWANVYKDGRKSLIHCKADTKYGVKRKVTEHMKDWGDGSRAIVRYKNDKSNNGHLFIAENHNGKIIFIDPQTGNSDCSYFFDYTSPTKTWMLRIDDKEFTSLIGQCCQ